MSPGARRGRRAKPAQAEASKARGDVHMIDVGGKEPTRRTAVARAILECRPDTLARIRSGALPKGSPLDVARVAAIQGAKRTSDLLPLCHPIRLTSVDVEFGFPSDREIEVRTTTNAIDRTGVEMEALTAAAVAALTIYDMCKGIDRGMTIREVALLEKRGGKSGDWFREVGA